MENKPAMKCNICGTTVQSGEQFWNETSSEGKVLGVVHPDCLIRFAESKGEVGLAKEVAEADDFVRTLAKLREKEREFVEADARLRRKLRLMDIVFYVMVTLNLAGLAYVVFK